MSLQHILVFTQDLVLLLRGKRWSTFCFRLPMVSYISDEDFECIERFVVFLYNITSHVFLWMSAASSYLQRSTSQLKAFHPQKQYWNNISSKPCCKAGKSVRVINEVPLDSLISKAFNGNIMLFMNQSFVCTQLLQDYPSTEINLQKHQMKSPSIR